MSEVPRMPVGFGSSEFCASAAAVSFLTPEREAWSRRDRGRSRERERG